MLPRTFMTASTRPAFSLASPLTRTSLNTIRTILAQKFEPDQNVYDPAERHAAVLVTLCNVNDKPGILMEVRSSRLRTHSGEVSFPGGKMDEADASTEAAALRETEEEVGIHPSQIENLGRFGPTEKSLAGLRVWPYVGFVHIADSPYNPRTNPTRVGDNDLDATTPLPSITLSSLKLSRNEVAHAFHFPLSAVHSAPRLHHYLFRGQRPYYAVDVSDIIVDHEGGVVVSSDGQARWESHPEGQDEIGGGKEGRLEVWGLTGWYLNVFMRTLGVYES